VDRPVVHQRVSLKKKGVKCSAENWVGTRGEVAVDHGDKPTPRHTVKKQKNTGEKAKEIPHKKRKWAARPRTCSTSVQNGERSLRRNGGTRTPRDSKKGKTVRLAHFSLKKHNTREGDGKKKRERLRQTMKGGKRRGVL